jgi:hypothetical protein
MGRARAAARTLFVACTLGSFAALVPATPAAADPPEPTNYRSEITSIDPSLPAGVELAVVGGDAFLELQVERGHTALVADYGEDPADPDARPYLRFGADGTVDRNRNADATAVNEGRYSTLAPGATGPADWEVVSTDGTYAWHDHRIHWMSSEPPRAVAPDGTVDLGGPDGAWEVLLLVDGEATTVQGRLALLDAPSPLPWLALAGAVVAIGVLLGRRRQQVPTEVVIAALAASLVAGVASWLELRAAPAGSGATIVGVAIAAAAAVAAALALAGPPIARLGATAASAAGLLGWVVSRRTTFTSAVLPTPVPGLDRTVTALALGLGLALAIAVVRWPPAVAPEAPPSQER